MIRPGQTFVWGRDRGTAQALLAAADQAGVDQALVRTTHDGFIVPDAVAEQAASDLAPVQDAVPPTPSGEEF